MDMEIVKDLLAEFDSHELTKLKVKWDEVEIEIEKEAGRAARSIPSPRKIEKPEKPLVEKEEEFIKEDLDESKTEKIVSPMVGTVYMAPDPDSKAFVKLGQRVEKGDVVCIIEAMKLMNEVEAETDGVIKEILVENEQMVEYDETLFIISTED